MRTVKISRIVLAAGWLILSLGVDNAIGQTPRSDAWCADIPQPAYCGAVRGARAEGWPAQTRSEVMAANGMVVTSQPLAAQAGLQVLRGGGNAVDAAVATGFAMAVT